MVIENIFAAMGGTDQISKLPETILEHILSLLVVKDSAKTSILSKAWNNAWTSLSCLDFGDKFIWESQDIIVDQILATRLKQKIHIKRFKLTLRGYWLPFVDSWIKILVACNTEELFLLRAIDTHKTFPEAIFAAKALKVLSSRGFKLELPSDDGIKFSSLQELHLEHSFLDDKCIQALCASCIDLEVLYLVGCHGLVRFQVAGTLPKLRTVKLKYCPPEFKMVDIVALNLIDLHISSSCQGLQVINITPCKSIKHLKLNAVAVNDQWLESIFSNLPNLEIRHLVSCSSLRFMKISSYRFKLLKVVACCNLTAVDLDTPNLLRFSSDIHLYEGGIGSMCDAVPTFKLKASLLPEGKFKLTPNVSLYTWYMNTMSTDKRIRLQRATRWYSTLTKSLGYFNHSGAIALSCTCDEVIVIPEDIRGNLFPPLYGTKRLHVKVDNRFNFSAVDVVDSLLWMSPKLDTLSIGQTRDLKNSLIKFTYRDDDEDEKPCCASLPWKCWRHELKKVKLQNFTRTELEKLRNYFLANTDILEIIEEPITISLVT